MNWSNLNELLLTYSVTYGSIVLASVFLLAALGLPLPSTLFVVAGGAFVQQGVLEPITTILLALSGVVIGDTLSYGMGHLLQGPIQHRYGQSAGWLRAEAYFARRGGIAILLTRFLLTVIAVPINLVAGSSGYPIKRFVMYDSAGELIWLLSYGSLGYLFGSQWEYISDLISNASGLLVGIAMVGVGVYALVRRQRGVTPGVVLV